MEIRKPLLAALGSLSLLLSLGVGQSQTFYGTVVGSVQDSTGAVIPGAGVTLTNLATGEQRVQETSTAGLYRFVNLVPGQYRLEARSEGFKQFSQEPVVVEVEASIRIDPVMEIGEVTEVVEVVSQTPLLQSQTSSLGQVVESRKVTETPLNGRNVLNLVALAPGVVPQGQSMQSPTGVNIFAWGNYQIGGGQSNQSATTLDGAPVNIGYANLTALVPTQDAVQEFKIQTNNLGAEFGRFAGGVINMTTKSGGNQFHGSAYEFLRNKVLNSNTFFNNASGLKTPPFVQNQWGANVGGPIVRDKVFFFSSYEDYRQRQGRSLLLDSPTPAMQGGDFSELDFDIHDPLTASDVGSLPRTPFPNKMIPDARQDATSKSLSHLWSQPNVAGKLNNNFANNASDGGDNTQFNNRADWTISDKHRLMGRWTWWDNLTFGVDPYGTGAHIDAGPETFTTNQIVLGDTYLFTPTTILDLRLSWTRFRYDRSPASQGIDLSQFAWPSSLVSQIPDRFRHIPTPCVESYGVFCRQGTGSIIIGRQENLAALPSLTLIRGRHTWKIGGDVRRLTHNYAQSNTPSGIFHFNANFTADNPFDPAGGYGFASFLLGTGTGGGITTPGLVAGQMIYRAAYVNDQWQVNDRLTVNLGLRWERSGNFSERFDNMTVLALDSTNPLSSETGLDLRGQLGLVNSDLRPGRTRLDDRHALAPRLGIAYRVTDTTVIRTGYGVFWLPNDVAFAVAPNQDIVTTISTPWLTSLDGGVTPYRYLNDPFPEGVLQPPGRDPAFLGTLIGGLGIRAPVPNQRLGYMQQWNFNIQHQLPEGTLVDLAYAGSKGTNLPVNAQTINQLPDQHLSLGTALNEQVANPFYGTSVATGGLSQPTVSRGQLLRPYPHFTDVAMAGPTNRSSTYHAFQAKVEKRLAGGASLLASYTASKLITDAGTLTGWLDGLEGFSAQGWATGGNNNDLRALKSLAAFDVSQRFVLSYVVDLPFGKGKPIGDGLVGVASKIVSGWGINGVTTIQRGFPIGVSPSQNLSNSYGGSQFVDNNGTSAELSGDPQTRLDEYFRTDVFSQPAAFTFGNTGRILPDVRGPGISQWDFAIFKRTQIGERLGVEFRTEFFNLFNTPIFRHPGTALGTPQFGVVGGTRGVPRLVQFGLRLLF